MGLFKVGDIVLRRSYGNDIYFKIIALHETNDKDTIYRLRGLHYRLEADSTHHDLIKQHPMSAKCTTRDHIIKTRLQVYRNKSQRGFFDQKKVRGKSGRILHVDSSQELMELCIKYYRDENLRFIARRVDEDSQPSVIRQLLESYRPDILVITGHDGLKKNNNSLSSVDNYRNSKHFIDSVKIARDFEPSLDKLCIFAGACQSYYEGIMSVGANFASSPDRVVINGLDPAIVSEKVALTDTRMMVTPHEIAELTISGRKGVWGINTKGHYSCYDQ